MRRLALILALPLLLGGCGQRCSPDAYATRAVQQRNRVEQGVVIGRRNVTAPAFPPMAAPEAPTPGG